MKTQIITTLSTLLSLSIFAQDAESVLPPPAYKPTSLYDIIINSGYIGIMIWIFIFLLIVTGLIIGPLAIIQSQKSKQKITPLSFKLLLAGIGFLYIFALLETTLGVIYSLNTYSIFYTSPQLLALSLSQRFYCLAFGLCGCIEYMLFLTISLIILHFKHKKLMEHNF